MNHMPLFTLVPVLVPVASPISGRRRQNVERSRGDVVWLSPASAAAEGWPTAVDLRTPPQASAACSASDRVLNRFLICFPNKLLATFKRQGFESLTFVILIPFIFMFIGRSGRVFVA